MIQIQLDSNLREKVIRFEEDCKCKNLELYELIDRIDAIVVDLRNPQFNFALFHQNGEYFAEQFEILKSKVTIDDSETALSAGLLMAKKICELILIYLPESIPQLAAQGGLSGVASTSSLSDHLPRHHLNLSVATVTSGQATSSNSISATPCTDPTREESKGELRDTKERGISRRPPLAALHIEPPRRVSLSRPEPLKPRTSDQSDPGVQTYLRQNTVVKEAIISDCEDAALLTKLQYVEKEPDLLAAIHKRWFFLGEMAAQKQIQGEKQTNASLRSSSNSSASARTAVEMSSSDLTDPSDFVHLINQPEISEQEMSQIEDGLEKIALDSNLLRKFSQALFNCNEINSIFQFDPDSEKTQPFLNAIAHQMFIIAIDELNKFGISQKLTFLYEKEIFNFLDSKAIEIHKDLHNIWKSRNGGGFEYLTDLICDLDENITEINGEMCDVYLEIAELPVKKNLIDRFTDFQIILKLLRKEADPELRSLLFRRSSIVAGLNPERAKEKSTSGVRKQPSSHLVVPDPIRSQKTVLSDEILVSKYFDCEDKATQMSIIDSCSDLKTLQLLKEMENDSNLISLMDGRIDWLSGRAKVESQSSPNSLRMKSDSQSRITPSVLLEWVGRSVHGREDSFQIGTQLLELETNISDQNKFIDDLFECESITDILGADCIFADTGFNPRMLTNLMYINAIDKIETDPSDTSRLDFLSRKNASAYLGLKDARKILEKLHKLPQLQSVSNLIADLSKILNGINFDS